MLFGQRATIQKGEVAKERRSENVVLTIAVTLALTFKQIRTHRYFPFAFM